MLSNIRTPPSPSTINRQEHFFLQNTYQWLLSKVTRLIFSYEEAVQSEGLVFLLGRSWTPYKLQLLVFDHAITPYSAENISLYETLHLQQVKVFHFSVCRRQNHSCRRIIKTILQQLLAKPQDNCCCSLFSEAATGSVLQKSVLKKFAKFTRKRLCWSLFLIKSQAVKLFSL